MWLFLTSKLRTWLIVTILVPIGGGLLRRAGYELQRRRGPSGVSNTLIRAGELTDRVRKRNRGGRR